MAVVKKAMAEDFENVYPLLQEINDPRLTKEDWKQLFVNHCDSKEDYFGYILFQDNKAIGFLGLVFSNRLINGEMRKFSNMTSWIIKKEYRRKGFGRLLLDEVTALKEYTITDLTASKETIVMLKRHGFKQLETNFVIIPFMPTISIFFNRCSVEFDQGTIKNHLVAGDLKIYNDHSKFKCIHLIIKTECENCYIIITKTKRKKIPLAQIHYISDLAIFLKYIQYIRTKVVLHLKVFGFLIDERFLKGQKVKYSITCKLSKFQPQVKMFKSGILDKDCITDNLYTELLVLNL